MSTSRKSQSSITVHVAGANGSEASYAMFSARDISEKGAFLCGDMFLERNEEFVMNLAPDGDDPIQLRARVVELDAAEPGMHVAFSALGDSERAKLAKLTDALDVSDAAGAVGAAET